jgi:hypothetical protein
MCQDCYLKLVYSEDERKAMTATDARLEPEFHHDRAYGIPFVGRDGVLSVRIYGRQPVNQNIHLIYDHPALLEAQDVQTQRQCACCRKWDKRGMGVQPGTYPAGRQWCGDCLARLRESRDRAQWLRRQDGKEKARQWLGLRGG